MMILYLGGFKPSMLQVAPQKMSLSGYNQMFMNSRIVSYVDKIPSKNSGELREITTKMDQVTRSYSSIKGYFDSNMSNPFEKLDMTLLQQIRVAGS